MKTNNILYTLIFALAIFISCSDSATGPKKGGEEEPPPNESQAPNVSGVIIYKVGVYDKAELFIVNADGTGKIQLTQNDTEDADADFNPATSEIVYVKGDKFDGMYIWKMNADGSNKVKLTSDGLECFNPVWKPDGSKILYSTGYYVAVMNPDGSDLTKIYDIGFKTSSREKTLKGEGGAIWSPDGTQILFHIEEKGIKNLYMMNTDGSNITKITNFTSESVSIDSYSFSPDGTKISFYRFYDHSKHAIYTVNTDGTNLNKVIGIDQGNMGSLSNHPKDDKILFMEASSGPQIANFDGSNAHTFVPNSVNTPGTPVWSPTGDYVAFSSGEEFANKNYENVIWLVKPNGEGLYQLESTLADAPITYIKWFEKK